MFIARDRAWTLALRTASGDPLARIPDGQADGYRHVYWQALMTISLGEPTAKLWGDLHETSNSATSTPRSAAMDYANNVVGRALGSALAAAGTTSDFSLMQAVGSADRNCQIIYYSFGQCVVRQP